jgi:DNA repair exonuclease SbcCD ATPase subunit
VSHESDVDDLFKLPPGEFTAARNALAARLKKAGHDDDASAVKMLPKPPASAWAVNQVYWRHRKSFDQLLAAGERFRKAQAAQLAGRAADLRGPLDARREALSELSKIAADVLRSAGYTATPDTMRRVNTTLEALATYGSHPGAPPAGRLTNDVDPPGFEALTALVPRGSRSGLKGTEPTRVIPFQRKAPEPRPGKKKKLDPKEEARQQAEERKAQQAAVRAAVQDAERTLRDARKAAADAEAALKKAAARAKDAERVKADLEKKFDKASAEADRARQDARRVAAEAEDAAQAVEDAERALANARAQLT